MNTAPTFREHVKPFVKFVQWLLVPLVLICLVLSVGVANVIFGVDSGDLVAMAITFVGIILSFLGALFMWAHHLYKNQLYTQSRFLQDVAYLSQLEWYKDHLPTYRTMQKDAVTTAKTFSTVEATPCFDENGRRGHATMNA